MNWSSSSIAARVAIFSPDNKLFVALSNGSILAIDVNLTQSPISIQRIHQILQTNGTPTSLTLDSQGKNLYIADSSHGIFQMNLETNTSMLIVDAKLHRLKWIHVFNAILGNKIDLTTNQQNTSLTLGHSD